MQIIELVFKKLLVISRWETLTLINKFTFDNGIIIMSGVSIEHPDSPIKKDPVWATVYSGGWIAIPLSENRTKILYINSSNPNGDIP